MAEARPHRGYLKTTNANDPEVENMCGIVGYVGPRRATDILLGGLARLEYRGYDSAGVAVIEGDDLAVVRRVGRLNNLRDTLVKHPLHGTTGIGHTRWATHGKPSEENAHPHADCTGRVAVVHNGIIENYTVAARRARGQRPHPAQRDGHRDDRAPHRELLRGRSGRRGPQGGRAPRGKLRHRRRAPRHPVHDRRGPQGLAADHRARRRREHRRQRHPRRARTHASGHGAPRRRDRRGQRRPDHRVRRRRRRRGRPGDDDGRVGPRRRREGRLRGLHAQGDPRAAQGTARDPARPDGRGRRSSSSPSWR